MLFNGKTQTSYKGHIIQNLVALEDEGDSMLTIRLAKFCEEKNYKFMNKFSIKINPAMARALANRLTDWADLAQASKSQAA